MNLLFAQSETTNAPAASTAVDSWSAFELGWPAEPWEWILYGGGFLVAILLSVLIYHRDTRTISPVLAGVLASLRVAVLLGLVVIALNPQERTQKMSFRPSRVALLVDNSLSMRFPEEDITSESSSTTRAEAVAGLLEQSDLIKQLQENHEVSLFTFSEELTGPHYVYPSHDRRQKLSGSSEEPPTPGKPETSEVPVVEEPSWSELLQPQGTETRLGESLVKVMRESGGKTFSGIAVITDGGANAGIAPSTANELARSTGARLVSIGVGGTRQPINLQLTKIQGPTEVHIRDPFQLTLFLQSYGLAGKQAKLELYMKPENAQEEEPTLLETKEVTLNEDGLPLEVVFDQQPTVPGAYEYQLKATSLDSAPEITLEDNQLRKSVEVVEKKTKILLMAGGPMRDYRFVRNMLYRHPAMESEIWLQSVEVGTLGQVSQESDKLLPAFPDTATQLIDYDVIIAFDVDWSRFDQNQQRLLNEWVSNHAGGLILIAGDVYTPELARAEGNFNLIRELYPVFLGSRFSGLPNSAQTQQAWPLTLTETGQATEFLQIDDNDTLAEQGGWKAFTGLFDCYPTNGVKAGATIYANHSDPRSETSEGAPVVLASQFFGAGYVLYIGSPELWRLRAVNEKYFDRFWTKSIREVRQGRSRRGNARGTILLERSQYFLGQNVRLRVKLLTPQLEPYQAVSIPLDVLPLDQSSKAFTINMKADPEIPGQFVGDFRTTSSGVYQLETEIPDSEETLTEKIDVRLPNLESDDPRQRVDLLTALTRDTGGKYLTLTEATSNLAEQFPNRGEEYLVDESLITLWDRQWVLYLLVGLLSLEWLIRKVIKLA